MARDLKGVMPALLTPFDNQQRLDIESLRRPVRFNIGQGVDGLYVGGSTGEAFVQNRVEREQVLEIVRRSERQGDADRSCWHGEHRRKPTAGERRASLRL